MRRWQPGRRGEGVAPDRDHRCRGGRRRVYGRRRAHDGIAQQAADRICAVESDFQVRMHGGTGVSLVGRARAVRLRVAVRPGRRWTAGPSYRGRATIRTSFLASAWASSSSGASRVTDEMFMAAAHALAEQVTEDDLQAGEPLSSAQAHSRRLGAHRGRRRPPSHTVEGSRRGPQPADLPAFMKSQHVRTPLRRLRGGLTTTRASGNPARKCAKKGK